MGRASLPTPKKCLLVFFKRKPFLHVQHLFPRPPKGGGRGVGPWGGGLGLASIFLDVSRVGVSASKAATAALLALTPTLPTLIKTDYLFLFFWNDQENVKSHTAEEEGEMVIKNEKICSKIRNDFWRWG